MESKGTDWSRVLFLYLLGVGVRGFKGRGILDVPLPPPRYDGGEVVPRHQLRHLAARADAQLDVVLSGGDHAHLGHGVEDVLDDGTFFGRVTISNIERMVLNDPTIRNGSMNPPIS